MGGDALQIAAVHRAAAAEAYFNNIMNCFLNAREAYPDSWHVAGMRVTAWSARATPSGSYRERVHKHQRVSDVFDAASLKVQRD